jgi:hypothetical protein
MPVEYTVDSLDTVDESIRGAYVETDGKFNFDPDKYAEVKAQGLKNKNNELLTKLKTKDDGLKRFEKFAELEDDDLNELLELREAKKNPPPADSKQPKGNEDLQAQFEKAQKRLTERHTQELADRDKTIASQDEKLKGYELTMPIRDAALKAGVIPEDLELVLKDVRERIVLNEERKIVVLDDDGDPTDVTLDKYFGTAYREQRPKFYAASGAAGSGAPSGTSRGGVKTMTISEFDKLPLPSQAAYAAEVRAGKAKLID